MLENMKCDVVVMHGPIGKGGAPVKREPTHNELFRGVPS